MNERIEELAEQADLLGECTPTKIPGRYVGYITEEQILKFAELIVRECVEQVWYTREDGINGNVSEVIKERIKQHFGVEY
jgi:hypothetical protein